MTITLEQLRALWFDANPQAFIDRADDAPVTKDDLSALAGGLDVDEDGNPEPGQWEVLLDQLNAEADDSADTWLDRVRDVAAARAARRAAAAAAEEEFNAVVQAAVLSKRVGVAAIAKATGLTPGRIYQIRDGRR